MNAISVQSSDLETSRLAWSPDMPESTSKLRVVLQLGAIGTDIFITLKFGEFRIMDVWYRLDIDTYIKVYLCIAAHGWTCAI